MATPGSEFPYDDLFAIENRPGAGVRLWGKAVEDQLDRVVEASNRHRSNHLPDRAEADKDLEAEQRLHIAVYFLGLAVRRVLRFHEAIAKQLGDDRLERAQQQFAAAAPQLKDFRDFYEHLDEYLLGSGRAQEKGTVAGRISPVLELRWDCANVVVRFGEESLDLTHAAEAAVALAKITAVVWEEYLDGAREKQGLPPDDGIKRMLEVTTSISTVIGGADEGHQVSTGVLLGVDIRPARPDEIDPER